VKKGALGFVEEGRRYLYHPLVSRQEGLLAQGRSILRRAKGSALPPLLAHFLREADLSSEQIAELRRVLDEREARS
jgi:BlaI family penicillinase repressor